MFSKWLSSVLPLVNQENPLALAFKDSEEKKINATFQISSWIFFRELHILLSS
jgi:hypothetical protein